MEGWKLHLSATVFSAVDVFEAAAPILRQHNALFKVPLRLEQLEFLNKGAFGFSQIGKFLTVYARSGEDAAALARLLHHATRGLAGPEIPFDQRYRPRSLVFYRYGSFRRGPGRPAGLITGPAGQLIRDRRQPGAAVPNWMVDPLRGKQNHGAPTPRAG